MSQTDNWPKGGYPEPLDVSHYPEPIDYISAKTRQVGGSHYTESGIQPYEYALANNLNYLESFALKYLTRHRKKGKAEDIRKAIHCLELLLEAEYGDECKRDSTGTD